MSTTKKRINISLPPDLELTLGRLAARDNVPEATKAVRLIQLAVEIDEDDMLNQLAEERDIKDAKFISHKDVWA